ncbi:MAG: hypothetical protein CML22_07335 [Rheinheimera sp.]|nr:hypothetical protein [Rheinheimera sp.]MBM34096.1 hypothetical protein [Rheinheimera sp.]
MFQNLFSVKRYLQQSAVRQVNCSRFNGRYTVHLLNATMTITLRRHAKSDVSIILKGSSDEQLYSLPSDGLEAVQSYLDTLILEINTA